MNSKLKIFYINFLFGSVSFLPKKIHFFSVFLETHDDGVLDGQFRGLLGWHGTASRLIWRNCTPSHKRRGHLRWGPSLLESGCLANSGQILLGRRGSLPKQSHQFFFLKKRKIITLIFDAFKFIKRKQTKKHWKWIQCCHTLCANINNYVLDDTRYCNKNK